MQETKLEVGAVIEGKVTGITKFGAFVDVGGGKTGMVAPVFVREIKDFITEGQVVKVRVLNLSEDGKISLSIKKAVDNPPSGRPPHRRDDRPGRPAEPVPAGPARPGDYEWHARENSGSFEDMMSRFKQTSDEKISDLRRAENKRGGYSRRGSRG